jgi:hypothetical protein
MRFYIGTKVVAAKPMNKQAAEEHLQDVIGEDWYIIYQ